MTLDTEYLGYTISYDEEKNEWDCGRLGISGKSLKGVKAVLSKRDADERRVGELPAFKVYSYAAGGQTCTLTLVADDRKSVWVRTKSGAREKERLSDLVLDTPANRAEVERAERHRVIAEEEGKKAKAILAAIPRVSLSELLAREQLVVPVLEPVS